MVQIEEVPTAAQAIREATLSSSNGRGESAEPAEEPQPQQVSESAGRPSVATFATAASAEFGGRDRFFTFFEELAEPVKKLASTAWAARGKLARDVKSYTVMMASTVLSMPRRVQKVVTNEKLHELISGEEDPQALAAVICGASGALCLGSSGAVIGVTVGGACGLVLGVIPAIFTFGLSLPVGAVMGGTCGFCVGSVVGGGAGTTAGAASGITVAYFREGIKYTVLQVAAFVYDAYDLTIVRPVAAVRNTKARVGVSVTKGKDYTKAKACAVGSTVVQVSANPTVRASALGAGVGAATIGTAGAATGTLVGGATGALVGVVPAIFTFGLSIPIGAMVGGTAGLCTGGAVGSTVGFGAGGVAGCVGYTYRSAPVALFNYAVERVRGSAATVEEAPADVPSLVVAEDTVPEEDVVPEEKMRRRVPVDKKIFAEN